MATIGVNAGLDSSDVELSYGEEANYGVQPATAYRKLRLTSEGFSEAKTRTRPDEIRSDGQASQARTTQVAATGSLSGGLSAGTYDALLTAMINADGFGAEVDESETDYHFDANGDLNSEDAALDNFDVGQFVRIGGHSEAGNNGVFRISSASAGRISLVGPGASFAEDARNEQDGADISGAGVVSKAGADFDDDFSPGDSVRMSGWAGAGNNDVFSVTAAAAGSITLSRDAGAFAAENGVDGIAVQKVHSLTVKAGGMTRNATNVCTFEIQKKMAAALYFYYPGSYVSGGSVSAQLAALATVSFDFLSAYEQKAVATRSTGAETDAPEGNIIDTVAGLRHAGLNRELFDDPAGLDTILQSIDFAVTKSNARSQYGVGSAEGRGIGRGTVLVEGTVTVYFRNFAMYDLYKNEEGRELSFVAVDDDEEGYVFSFPNVTLVNPSILAGGPDTDLIASFTMEGNPGSFDAVEVPAASPFTMQIDKVIK